MLRTDWNDLDASARAAIEAHTGLVFAAKTASEGKNSQVAAFLETADGTIFVKGLRIDNPRVVTQHREAAINPYVYDVSPALLWHIEHAGWNLLGFAHSPGRHADYRPSSADLSKVVDVMARLADLPCPDLRPLKRAEQRWSAYLDDTADMALLAGDNLLHTDWAPDNVLIDGSTARLIDWAWPTKGAAFVDPACFIVRLVFAGHTPAEAETVVADLPAWQTTDRRTIDVFAAALSRMWTDIATADPTPWKQQTSAAASAWHTYRQDTRLPGTMPPLTPTR